MSTGYLWRSHPGGHHLRAPVVYGDTLALIAKPASYNDPSRLHVLDARSGQQRWSAEVPPEAERVWIRRGLVLVEDRSPGPSLTARAADTGEVLWTLPGGGRDGPIDHHGALIPNAGHLVAIDGASGCRRCRRQPGECALGTPVRPTGRRQPGRGRRLRGARAEPLKCPRVEATASIAPQTTHSHASTPDCTRPSTPPDRARQLYTRSPIPTTPNDKVARLLSVDTGADVERKHTRR